MRDPYSILGVKHDADSDEIKAAWRSKAKTVHPDHNRDDPDATARFTEIGQAYDLLKDPNSCSRSSKGCSFSTLACILMIMWSTICFIPIWKNSENYKLLFFTYSSDSCMGQLFA